MPSSSFAQGSLWRKWDLHVHTPASRLNNQFGQDWDTYVTALFRSAIQNGICAIGLTDYFTIDGYRRVQEGYLENAAKLAELFDDDEVEAIRRILVLPNIEFRLASLADGARVNFHVLLDPSISPTDIEQHLLQRIQIKYAGRRGRAETTVDATPTGFREVGDRLIRENEGRYAGRDPIQLGMEHALIDEETILGALDARPHVFRDGFLIGAADAGLNQIDWFKQGHIVRQSLIQKSDFLFTSNPTTRAWALGKEPYEGGPSAFVEEFRSVKPCLWGSDAHGYPGLYHPCAKRCENTHNCEEHRNDCEPRHCWVKADPTFEGLKQIICEPASRIRIQSGDPTPTRALSLRAVEVVRSEVNPDLSIADTLLPMNAGLVAVTGGRGAGKTALVDLVANCFHRRIGKNSQSSFVSRVTDECNEIPVTITFTNGDEYEKPTTDTDGYHPAKPVYIPQGELHRQVTGEGGFDGHVWSLLHSDPHIRDAVAFSSLGDAKRTIDRLTDEIESAHADILRLVSETTPELSKQLDADLAEQITLRLDLEAQISQSTLRISDDDAAAAERLEEQRDALKDTQGLATQLCEDLHSILRFFTRELPDINDSIRRSNASLERMRREERLPEFSYAGSADVEALQGKIRTVADDAASSIATLQADSESLAAKALGHQELLAKRKAASDAILRTERAREGFEASALALVQRLTERDEAVSERASCWQRLRDTSRDLAAEFADRATAVLRDLDFSADMRFGREELVEAVGSLVDQRKAKVVPTNQDEGALDSLFKAADRVATGQHGATEEYAREVNVLLDRLKDALVARSTLQALYGVLYADYFSIVPVVKYKRTPLPKLSLGQKATVLLKIFLAQGNQPIIIDSHDDYLDNAFIMDELVTTLRHAKEHRQIIMVSNNGNVVINSDAEQIILARRDDNGEISYTSGSIENPDIRVKVLDVLEGGEAAFLQRQNKYRLGATV